MSIGCVVQRCNGYINETFERPDLSSAGGNNGSILLQQIEMAEFPAKYLTMSLEVSAPCKARTSPSLRGSSPLPEALSSPHNQGYLYGGGGDSGKQRFEQGINVNFPSWITHFYQQVLPRSR